MKKSLHNLKQNLPTQATNSMEVYVSSFFDPSSPTKASASYISAIHNAEAGFRSSCNAAVQRDKTHWSRRRRMGNAKILSKRFFILSAISI